MIRSEIYLKPDFGNHRSPEPIILYATGGQLSARVPIVARDIISHDTSDFTRMLYRQHFKRPTNSEMKSINMERHCIPQIIQPVLLASRYADTPKHCKSHDYLQTNMFKKILYVSNHLSFS